MKKNFGFWLVVWLIAVMSGAAYSGWSWSGLIGATLALVWLLWPAKKPVSAWDNPEKSALSKHIDER